MSASPEIRTKSFWMHSTAPIILRGEGIWNKDISWLQRRFPHPYGRYCRCRHTMLGYNAGKELDGIVYRCDMRKNHSSSVSDARWFLSELFPESRSTETTKKLVPFKGYNELCSGSPSEGEYVNSRAGTVWHWSGNTCELPHWLKSSLPAVERICRSLSIPDFSLSTR